MKKTNESTRLGGELRSSQIAAELVQQMKNGRFAGCTPPLDSPHRKKERSHA